MKYINKKNRFINPYMGRVIENLEEIELDRDLKGIETQYLVPIQEKVEKKLEKKKQEKKIEHKETEAKE